MSLQKKVLELKIALGSYTDATDVQSFGYEELRDNGAVARAALGFGDHDPKCPWPSGATDEEGMYLSGEHCTCGLQQKIDDTIALWVERLEKLNQ